MVYHQLTVPGLLLCCPQPVQLLSFLLKQQPQQRLAIALTTWVAIATDLSWQAVVIIMNWFMLQVMMTCHSPPAV
jgi:hypothetical protein